MNATHSQPPPGAVSELLGSIAYAFAEVQPYLPMYTHLILSALFPIYTGAHASLCRPSSAAKPPPRKERRAKKEQDEDSDDDDDDDSDDESGIQKMEGLSPSDAIMFPVLAGCTLTGLYFLIKYMGKDMLNKILSWYFSSFAVFSVARLVDDALSVLESFCWPDYYVDEGVLWHVNARLRKVEEHGTTCARDSPLPGIFGRVGLPEGLSGALWRIRELPRQKYVLRVHIARVTSFKIKLTLRTIWSSVVGLAAVVISVFFSKAWWLTNLQGFAFSYSALQLMSPTTFATGSLILAALFFYDIYFVFYTPLMVTVATNLDIPIKLLFPRPLDDGETVRRLAMLGLGDIVLPGIVIGLALRFDLYMHYLKKQTQPSPTGAAASDDKSAGKGVSRKARYHKPTGHWGNRFWTSSLLGRSLLPPQLEPATDASTKVQRKALIPNFPKPYFYAAVAGYVLGMCVTLGVMQVFQHAQPALLYLVPGVLSSVWIAAVVRGELKEMWHFSEAATDGDDEEEEKKKKAEQEQKTARDGDDEKKKKKKKEAEAQTKKSWWQKSFFFSENNAEVVEKHFAKHISRDDDDDDEIKSANENTSVTDNAYGNSTTSSSSSDAKPTPSTTRRSCFSVSLKRAHPRRSSVGAANVSRDSTPTTTSIYTADEETPRWRGRGSHIDNSSNDGTVGHGILAGGIVGDDVAAAERAGKRLRTG